MTIGTRLRDVRQGQELSLTDVARKAGISAATLSRIETDKQGIGLELFLTLAQLLKAETRELLGEEGDPEPSPLVKKIAGLNSTDRTQLWRDLAVAGQQRRRKARPDLAARLEELIAQFDYLRQEIESLRSSMRRR